MKFINPEAWLRDFLMAYFPQNNLFFIGYQTFIAF